MKNRESYQSESNKGKSIKVERIEIPALSREEFLKKLHQYEKGNIEEAAKNHYTGVKNNNRIKKLSENISQLQGDQFVNNSAKYMKTSKTANNLFKIDDRDLNNLDLMKNNNENNKNKETGRRNKDE